MSRVRLGVPGPRKHGITKCQIAGSDRWVRIPRLGRSNSGWIGLDPTLGKPLGLQHFRIAYGRDYGDVAPVRDVYKGHAGQRLSVGVSVRPSIDVDGPEQLGRNQASASEVPAIVERPQQPAQQQQ